MGIKFRLIAMNFLQYAIWGSWLISLGAYLGGGLDFSGLQIGSFFATMGIASLFMPAVMGIIADRWIPAQKLLGICHLISGAFLIAAASQTALRPAVQLHAAERDVLHADHRPVELRGLQRPRSGPDSIP